MNILHLRGAQGRVGGIENCVFDMVRSEQKAGFSSKLAIALKGEAPFPILDRASALGLSPLSFPMQSRFHPAGMMRWAGVVLRSKPSLLHLHDATALLLRSVTLPLSRIPAVFSAHGWTPGKDKKYADLHLQMLRLVDRIVVDTEALRSTYGELLGGTDKVVLIPPGVDASLFRPEAGTGAMRRDIRIPQGEQVVGLVARLNGDRQPGDYLRAAVRIQQRHPDAWFAVVGDGKLRAYLDAMEPARALGPRIRFAGHRDDMPGVYPDLTMMLVTWNPTAVPRAVLEAMAAGVPIIAGKSPVMESVIENGVSGVLVPEGNFQVMAVRAAELLADSAKAKALGQGARARILAHFTLEAQMNRTQDLYRTLSS